MIKFDNENQITGAIHTLVHIYSENINRLDTEKYFHFVVRDWQTKFKVTFKWTNGAVNDRTEWIDDHFYLLKSEGVTQLEKYVNDAMDFVTKDKTIINS